MGAAHLVRPQGEQWAAAGGEAAVHGGSGSVEQDAGVRSECCRGRRCESRKTCRLPPAVGLCPSAEGTCGHGIPPGICGGFAEGEPGFVLSQVPKARDLGHPLICGWSESEHGATFGGTIVRKVRGIPPIRQEDGEWMGHGAFVVGREWENWGGEAGGAPWSENPDQGHPPHAVGPIAFGHLRWGWWGCYEWAGRNSHNVCNLFAWLH